MKPNNDWGLLILIIWFIVFALLTAYQANADEETVWLTTGMWSKHNNDRTHDEWNPNGPEHAKYNNINTGIGVQYDYTRVDSISVGMYRNSINRHTNYAIYMWRPLQSGCWKAGAFGGLATGYTRDLPAIPVGALLLSCDGSKAGFNITWLPSVVIAIQLKVKVW